MEELPYWETINNYLKRVNPEELQNTVCALVKRLIRSRAFEDARIRGRYWHILIDGSGIVSSREALDGNYILMESAMDRNPTKQRTETQANARILENPKACGNVA